MLGFGALCEHPLADYGFTGPPVNISLPAVALTFAAPALGIQAGKNVSLPPLALLLGKPALGIQAGKNINLPPLSITLATPAIHVGTGIHVSLPPVPFLLATPAAGVRAGKHISLHNSFDVTVETGALGEDALGAYAIGVGPPITLTYRVPLRFTLSAPALAVRAGKHVNLPVKNITLGVKTIEVGARRRKIRVNAIAS